RSAAPYQEEVPRKVERRGPMEKDRVSSPAPQPSPAVLRPPETSACPLHEMRVPLVLCPYRHSPKLGWETHKAQNPTIPVSAPQAISPSPPSPLFPGFRESVVKKSTFMVAR